MDLPSIVESHKTLDRKVVYKTGDICQMIECSGGDEDEDLPDKGNIDEMTAAKKKELYKKFVSNHGSELLRLLMGGVNGCGFSTVTPPMKNLRKRRFRKTKIKKVSESSWQSYNFLFILNR